jgi:hypothetical protein
MPNFEDVKISKARYGEKDVDAAKDDKVLKYIRVSKSMKEGGWLDIPKSPQDIPKAFQVFKRKNSTKAKEVYALLLARSRPTGGVTKIFNKEIALHLKISERQVERIMRMLHKAKLIAITVDYFMGKDGNPRKSRMIMVWAAYFVGKCYPIYIGWKLFKNDPRIESIEFEHARKQIPIKFTTVKPFTGTDKEGQSFTIQPENVDWYYLEYFGIIDEFIRIEIQIYEELIHNPLHSSKFERIMGGKKWIRMTKKRQSELFD